MLLESFAGTHKVVARFVAKDFARFQRKPV
jgi:hypothetical protein